nr:Uncharacterised protein [Streptococcus thermophilus]
MITATWRGDSLISDSGAPLAVFDPSTRTLTAEGVSIEVEHSAGAMRWKVTGEVQDDTGERFSVRTHGIGVGTLTARCGSRTYKLERGSALSKTRTLIDVSGAPCATTSPKNGLDLAVTQNRDMPFADLMFLTWALTLIDTPARRTLY